MSIGVTTPRRCRRLLSVLITSAAVASAGVRISGRELPGSPRRERTRRAGHDLLCRVREHRHTGIEFARDDCRCRGRQCGPDDVLELARAGRSFDRARGATVPANTEASIGQTSLLGSTHVALSPPLGQEPDGHLAPGTTIPPVNKSSIFPSTEQTLSSLSVVVNGGGTRSDRRYRPQFQRSAVRTPERHT